MFMTRHFSIFQCPTQEIHLYIYESLVFIGADFSIHINSIISFNLPKDRLMCPNIQGNRIIQFTVSYHSNTTWRGVNCCHWHKQDLRDIWEQSHFFVLCWCFVAFLSRRRCFYLFYCWFLIFLRATVPRCYRSTVKILRHFCNKTNQN